MWYLYVKQHGVTGLKYFGITKSTNPQKYKGSGKYWKDHLKKHGSKFVETIHLWSYEDLDTCREFALKFSEENDIVNSNEWANLMNETCVMGWEKGRKQSLEHISKRIPNYDPQNIRRGYKSPYGVPAKRHSAEHNRRVSEGLRGKIQSPETRAKRSKALSKLKWWTDGSQNKRSETCPASGWVLGRTV